MTLFLKGFKQRCTCSSRINIFHFPPKLLSHTKKSTSPYLRPMAIICFHFPLRAWTTLKNSNPPPFYSMALLFIIPSLPLPLPLPPPPRIAYDHAHVLVHPFPPWYRLCKYGLHRLPKGLSQPLLPPEESDAGTEKSRIKRACSHHRILGRINHLRYPSSYLSCGTGAECISRWLFYCIGMGE